MAGFKFPSETEGEGGGGAGVSPLGLPPESAYESFFFWL